MKKSGVQAFSGVPLIMLLVWGLPRSDIEQHLMLYAAVMVVFGLCVTWCQTGCNSPIFADITPEHLRSLIFAFDRCFEGALAAFAAPVVGLIAEGWFGYKPFDADADSPSVKNHNGDALGNSLIVCCAVPFVFCTACYSGAVNLDVRPAVLVF